MDASRPNDTAAPSGCFLPDLPGDPTPRDWAIYTVSVSPSYAIDAYAKNWSRPLPQNINPGEPCALFCWAGAQAKQGMHRHRA